MTEIHWRSRRLSDLSKNAWMWCKNNNLTFIDEDGEEVVNHETMKNATTGFNLAGCVFFPYKYRRNNR